MGTRQKRLTLERRVASRWPDWTADEVGRAIRAGEILVAGRSLVNPLAQVDVDAAIRHVPPEPLAGHRKLAWALQRFGVDADGRRVVDVGASTGGFTRAWLEAGAVHVDAVDVGHGQLLGALRLDPRVTTWERTNVADLSPALIPGVVDRISVDVSYLSLSSAVGQSGLLRYAPDAELLGLIKPMFELRLPTIPTDRAVLEEARDAAVAGVREAGWAVADVDECPVHGARGAVEFFVHAVRGAPPRP